jgi:hypothetical protein
VLKHVCEVGNLSESGPSRWMMHFMFPRPPIGARSEPAEQMTVRVWCRQAHAHLAVQNLTLTLTRSKRTSISQGRQIHSSII